MTDSWVIAGSRDWPETGYWLITEKIIELVPTSALVITGGASGVDKRAHSEARRLGYRTEVDRANWNPGGVFNPRAGLERNIRMLERDPVGMLAFHWGRSPGTAHIVRECYKRRIRCWYFTGDDLRPNLAALDLGDIE
jgi:hypothetical protein